MGSWSGCAWCVEESKQGCGLPGKGCQQEVQICPITTSPASPRVIILLVLLIPGILLLTFICAVVAMCNGNYTIKWVSTPDPKPEPKDPSRQQKKDGVLSKISKMRKRGPGYQSVASDEDEADLELGDAVVELEEIK
eukprot:TRINITY_DN9931_c0_g1_i2.p1 TRINITY_DN9931_c0_g1~~TRINITY_DN9931_c0_g1_i2.p1  ORF type:complete len:137 (+),score=40.08 TRINITY_DN9931_c0_g1_i2:342-752(+)